METDKICFELLYNMLLLSHLNFKMKRVLCIVTNFMKEAL